MRISKSVVLSTFVGCLMGAFPAWAGFAIMNSPNIDGPSDAQVAAPSSVGTVTAPISPANNYPTAANSDPVIPAPTLAPAVSAPIMNTGSMSNALSMPMTDAVPKILPSIVTKGFGRDIPLAVAVRQIVPDGTTLNFDQGVDSSIPITWHGGKVWRQVLTEALARNSLGFTEYGSTITIGAVQNTLASARIAPALVGPAAMPPAQPNSGVLGRLVTTYPSNVPLAPPINQPAMASSAPMQTAMPVNALQWKPIVATKPVKPMWTAKSNDTLRQTFAAWCKQAGVILRWDSEYDYPVETDISISGDFETAVRMILRGLKNASPHPVAQFYRGKPGVPGVLLVPPTGTTNPTNLVSDSADDARKTATMDTKSNAAEMDANIKKDKAKSDGTMNKMPEPWADQNS